MNVVQLIYFSPTQTTRKVLEGIAQGIGTVAMKHVDLTLPDTKAQQLLETHDSLAIIEAPVYAGRLPIEAVSRLQRLKGNGTPAVIIVMYGNRAYEDALLELRDVALEAGFKPIAAGAFIGEHSFSTAATPIGVGRPDVEDLRKAQEFGKTIREKMKAGLVEDSVRLQVPGNSPYKERAGFSNITPAVLPALCAKCGRCVSICPTAAITIGAAPVSDAALCIRCCACIKGCDLGAREMNDQRIRQVAEMLSQNFSERKEPEIYV